MDYQEFQEEYQNILLTADSRRAFGLLKLIDDGEIKIEENENLDESVVILKWIALDRLADDEVARLFKEHLIEGLSLEFYNLIDQLKNKFLFLAENKQDDYKKQLLEALKNNQQVFNTQSYVNNSGQKLANTVAVWLKDYITFGGVQPLTNIKQLEFYRTNKNWHALTEPEREKLRLLISLVEWLKHSVFSLRGTPEADCVVYNGKYYGIINGQLYDADNLIEDLSPKWSSGILNSNLPNISAVPVASAPVKPPTNNLTKITDLYQANLTTLQNKYQINQGILTYKDYQLTQLKDLLLAEIKNPKIALPVLAVIIAKEGGLKLLEEELPVKLAVGENSKNKLKEAIFKLLLGAGLTQAEAAVYLMHLAKSNKNLAGWAYADLKDSNFKLRN